MDKLKILLLENKYPFFTEEELQLFLDENNNDVYKTASELCYLKADGDKNIKVGPIEIEGAGSEFWINLAKKYSIKAKELTTSTGNSGGYKTSMARGDGY